MEEEGGRGARDGPKPRLSSVLAVGGLLLALERNQLDQEQPKAVRYTRRSTALANEAFRLAEEGREDEGAAQELRRAAGRRHVELRRAASRIRFDGWVNDSEVHDRANRLLLSAAGGHPIQSVTPERRKWFRTLHSLQHGPHDSGYEFLASRQPALRTLEADIHAEADRRAPASDGDPEEARTELLWEILDARLGSLVGPEATDEPDPLLRTRTALTLAYRHLTVVFGLPDPPAAELRR